MRLNSTIKIFWLHPRWTSWVIGLLLLIPLLVVIDEVLDLKHQIDLAHHDAEVSRIRAALVEKWVHQQVEPAQQVVGNLAGMNPMRLMLNVPVNYLGEYMTPPDGFRKIWFFDMKNKCLVYIFENGDFAAYRLIGRGGKTSSDVNVIGDWRLVRDSSYRLVRTIK